MRKSTHWTALFLLTLAGCGLGDSSVPQGTGTDVWVNHGRSGGGGGGSVGGGPGDRVPGGGGGAYEGPEWAEGDDNTLQTSQLGLYTLQPAQGCEEATAIWRAAAIAQMEQALLSARNSVISPDVCWDYGYDGYWGGVMDCSAESDSGGWEEEDDEGADEYSTTNTQEVGVDEADFLKNDGKTIFMLANGKLQIIDAWPPEQAHKISETALPGTPKRMYVHEERAVVFSAMGQAPYGWGQDCSYGYDCDFTGDGVPLRITVWDLSDLAHPEKTREIDLSGSYLNSRRVEDFVYSFVYFDAPTLPTFKSCPDSLLGHCWGCTDDGQPAVDIETADAAFDALHAQNVAAINAMQIDDWLPTVKDTWYVDGQAQVHPNPMSTCEGFYLSQAGDGMSLMSLLSFDMTDEAAMGASTIVASPGAVYGTKQSLYIAIRHYKWFSNSWFEEVGEDSLEATTFHKFLLAADSPATGYVGSGVAPGRILNQFSMSEYEGDLRVATTSGQVFQGATNGISVLRMQDGGLEVIGQVSGLAPGEDIRSVRFSGPLGFIVTFKKTDPLYVIDLADPEDPKVEGELKIPGFSTYMHFMDPGHILSIGYDADDQGSFAWFTGVMLQVFDVTDITDPKLLHKEVIGTRGTTSDAATNHLAFNYFKPKDLLALPMVVCEEASGSGGSYGEEMTFSGLMLYDVTVADGFTYIGGVPHETTTDFDTGDWYSEPSCNNWWTQSNSKVKRSVIMDDWVFSVAMDEIRVAAIANPGTVLAIVDL